MKYLTYDGKEYAVKIDSYACDPTIMCVSMTEKEYENDRSYAHVLTVNIGKDTGNNSRIMFCSSFIDVNNVAFPSEDAVEKTGLAVRATRFGAPIEKRSGFVVYPLYDFNQSMLKELDPEGFERYKQHWIG